MTPARPRYPHIERLAEGLLHEAGVSAPPVPVERIVEARQIGLEASDLKDVSGLVVRRAGAVVIGVNKTHPATRRRFTVAHELGHALLHQGKPLRYDRDFRVDFRAGRSSLGSDVEEMEANFFAACLLMPRSMLEADPLAAQLDAEDAAQTVAALARRYKVSPHAMAIRIGNLAVRRTAFGVGK